MLIKTKYYSLEFDDKTGSLVSFHNGKKQFIHNGAAPSSVFTLRIRDKKGIPKDLSCFDARKTHLVSEEIDHGTVVIMSHENLADLPIKTIIHVLCKKNEPFTYWDLSIQNLSDSFVDCIDFPNVVVPNDLVATGGDSKILWSGMEGALIDDMEIRENSWLTYHPIEFPNRGWEGYYPGPCPTQLMAYYGNEGGLYFAAHDEQCNIKGIEFRKHDGGIKLEFRLYPGAIKGFYQTPYDMVLGFFQGDWHDAAEIYRKWLEQSAIPKPVRLIDNDKIPQWLQKSPVVVTYPVRGTRDMGDMTPNEYFPYTNVLPHIENLSQEIDSSIMVLLMHWEGSAPWAPPYVWPPFGGEENFRELAQKLHEKGHSLGVYCSGIAWTMKSNLWDYNKEKEFKEKNLIEIMNAAPSGEIPYSLICSGEHGQRWSYDMCPSQPFVEDVVTSEVKKIIDGGCDYIQFFDQNLGGAAYFCYSKKHGHPPAPGVWMKDAMIKIFKHLQRDIEKSGKEVLIGCESAAAEPFIPYLKFNDLRFETNRIIGTPVPLYAFLFHEYVNNFMGNQCGACTVIKFEEFPENILYRIAYSFSNGDLITLVLGGKGKINWDWNREWDVPKPDQEALKTLVRNLTSWRNHAAKEYLCFGRMLKPLPVESASLKMIMRFVSPRDIPAVLTTRWRSPQSKEAQIIINYTKEVQKVFLNIPDSKGNDIRIIRDPKTGQTEAAPIHSGKLEIDIPPLSAILLQF